MYCSAIAYHRLHHITCPNCCFVFRYSHFRIICRIVRVKTFFHRVGCCFDGIVSVSERCTQKCCAASKVTWIRLFLLVSVRFSLEFMDMSVRVILCCCNVLHFYIQHKMGCKLRGFTTGRAWWRSRWLASQKCVCGGSHGIISLQ